MGGAAESLAAGVPTISTNVGGFPDIVVNGKTGYTADKASPMQLANAIDQMLQNYPDALEMAKTGQKHVEKLLDINYTSQEVYEFYKNILEMKR